MHFTLADLITDIAQNAAEAGSSLVELEITETDKGAGGRPEFRFVVKDNGRGMSEEELAHATDPFVTDRVKHPGRKIGLGIPFLIHTAGQSGGGWDLKSENKGELHGTTVTAWFDLNNVDTPPVGDLSGMFRTIFLFEGPGDVRIRRSLIKENRAGREYEVRKSDLAKTLGELEDAQSLILLDQYLRSLEEGD
ncbi:MAG: ATP-binding protein [Treponema sp.]|nr:ATP-binding protein [Treponema sp.]